MLDFNINKVQKDVSSALKSITDENMKIAASRAMNFTLAKANTRTNREIRNVYKIALADLNDSNQKRKRNSTPNSLTAMIYANMIPLSLSKFNPVQINNDVKTGFVGGKKKGGFASRKVKGGDSGVTVEIIKGQKETIDSAFLRFFSSGKGAVFARGQYGKSGFVFGKPRLPIESLNTKSVFYAIQAKPVRDGVYKEIDDTFGKRLVHELSRIK